MDSVDSDDLATRRLPPQLPASNPALHSTTHHPTIQTLPSVHALLSSSASSPAGSASLHPSTEFMSPNHRSGPRHALDDPHAVRRSTPPNGSFANPPVDRAVPPLHSPWAAVNRTNTNSTTINNIHPEPIYAEDTPTSRTQDHQFTRRPVPQTTTLSRCSALTAQVRNGQPQDEPPPSSGSPINAHSRRQDSAFSEQSCTLEPLIHAYSDSPSSHTRRAPNPIQHNSDTHAPTYYRTTPSPPVLSSSHVAPPPSMAQPNSVTTTSKAPHRRHTPSRSLSYATPTPPAPTTSLERLNESTTPVNIKAQKNSKSNGASPSSLPDNLPSASRSRYDTGSKSQSVTNHMKPRQHSPYEAIVAPARPASTEATPRPTPTQARPAETVRQRRPSPASETADAHGHAAPEHPPSHNRPYFASPAHPPNATHAPPPRCNGCGAIWSYPLPNLASLQQFGQTQTRNEFARANEGMRALLQRHREDQDNAYSQWKWDHSHCLLREHPRLSPSSPSTIDSQDTVSQNGKRKAEAPHEDGQISTKLRKVTFDRNSPVPQSVRVQPSI